MMIFALFFTEPNLQCSSWVPQRLCRSSVWCFKFVEQRNVLLGLRQRLPYHFVSRCTKLALSLSLPISSLPPSLSLSPLLPYLSLSLFLSLSLSLSLSLFPLPLSFSLSLSLSLSPSLSFFLSLSLSLSLTHTHTNHTHKNFILDVSSRQQFFPLWLQTDHCRQSSVDMPVVLFAVWVQHGRKHCQVTLSDPSPSCQLLRAIAGERSCAL